MPDVASLTDWRRRVAALYAAVRTSPSPAEGHARWTAGRDELFRHHPQTPLPAGDPLRSTGLPYWPYDPGLRFEVLVAPPVRDEVRGVTSAGDGVIRLRLAGHVRLPGPDIDLDVWWLDQYAGGLFVPLRDGTAGRDSYGGGRYLLDTAKGADLGGTDGRIVVDLNFAYHPSCRYDPAWECPLAPEGNTTPVPVEAGERLPFG